MFASLPERRAPVGERGPPLPSHKAPRPVNRQNFLGVASPLTVVAGGGPLPSLGLICRGSYVSRHELVGDCSILLACRRSSTIEPAAACARVGGLAAAKPASQQLRLGGAG